MERDFKGVWISKEIWLNKNLTALDKIILTEIDSLDNEDGCTASNEYLAEFCQCSVTKISNSIAKLIDMKYIYQESFNGRVRTLRSSITKSVRQTYKNCKPELQKVQTNNIEYKNNIIKHIYGEYKHVRLTDEEYKRLIEEYGETPTKDAIKYLDEYIEMKGASYKNHNLVLRKWVYEAVKSKKQIIGREYTQKQFDEMYDEI